MADGVASPMKSTSAFDRGEPRGHSRPTSGFETARQFRQQPGQPLRQLLVVAGAVVVQVDGGLALR